LAITYFNEPRNTLRQLECLGNSNVKFCNKNYIQKIFLTVSKQKTDSSEAK